MTGLHRILLCLQLWREPFVLPVSGVGVERFTHSRWSVVVSMDSVQSMRTEGHDAAKKPP